VLHPNLLLLIGFFLLLLLVWVSSIDNIFWPDNPNNIAYLAHFPPFVAQPFGAGSSS
jgi:hypothetical protein